MPWHVYMLRLRNGNIYFGHTKDLEERLHSHDRTDRIAGAFTRKNGPWELVWIEGHLTRSAAVARER